MLYPQSTDKIKFTTEEQRVRAEPDGITEAWRDTGPQGELSFSFGRTGLRSKPIVRLEILIIRYGPRVPGDIISS